MGSVSQFWSSLSGTFRLGHFRVLTIRVGKWTPLIDKKSQDHTIAHGPPFPSGISVLAYESMNIQILSSSFFILLRMAKVRMRFLNEHLIHWL